MFVFEGKSLKDMKIHIKIKIIQTRGIPAGFLFRDGNMKKILLLLLLLFLSNVGFAECVEGEVELWDVCYNIEETTHLELHNVSGVIPPEIGNLINLTYLNIEGNSNNQLIGEIPSEIGNLVYLTELSLELNQLSGEIPSEIGNLVSLVGLWLFDNQLSGVIPPEIGNLVGLSSLKIENNQLSGQIPQEICDLTFLIPNYNNWLFQIQNNNFCPPHPFCIEPFIGYQDCIDDIFGCMDTDAINYDPQATIDNGDCYYLSDIDQHFQQNWQGIPINPMGIYVHSAILDSVNLRVGDEIAVFDENECIGMIQLTDEITSQVQIFLSEDDPDTPEIDGFEEEANIIYKFWDASEQIEIINVYSTLLNGNDVFTPLGFSEVELSVYIILGCTDPNSFNYSPDATVDNGNCNPQIIGCMDPEACNYDPEANDQGICFYYDCTNECDGEAYYDDCDVCDDDPTNDNGCFGCMDQWALNYDPSSTNSDDSCEYPSVGDISMDGYINVNDIVLLVGVVLDGEYYIDYMDINQDFYLNIIDIVILVDIILNPEYLGCTDPNAGNYNPEALYSDGSCDYSYIVDIDGNVYSIIVIGEQQWMGENLRVSHYRNGDPIPTGFNGNDWGNLDVNQTGAYSLYEDDPTNGELFGFLFNWFAVDDERGICPESWHIPSDDEWMELEMYLGMSYEEAHDTSYRGTDQGSQLAGNGNLWEDGDLMNDSAFGSSGFIALPDGYRNDNDGNYHSIGNVGYFWSYSVTSSDEAWYRLLHYSTSEILRLSTNKRCGFSVRCIMD